MKLISELFFPNDTKGRHIKVLDGLRGLAVLFVLLSHSSRHNIMLFDFFDFRYIGHFGVFLFFVMSAYLLDRQILVHLLVKKQRKYWSNYAVRRFLRIYPLFMIALFLNILLNYYELSQYAIGITWSNLVDHLLLIKGEGIFWSIAVEFKYYLISPLLLLFCHSFLKWNERKVNLAFIFTIVFSIIAPFIINFSEPSTIRFLSIFLIGSYISVAEIAYSKVSNLKARIRNFDKKINYLAIGSIVLIVLTFESIFTFYSGFDRYPFHHSLFHIFYGVLWGVIMVALLFSKGTFQNIFEWKILRLYGIVSYSAYLFHMPILKFVEMNIKISGSIKLIIFLSLVFLVSSIFYFLIEKPLSKIRIK
jgi:peptidoglycan/LPS O-acetylase OafA/YrhL